MCFSPPEGQSSAGGRKDSREKQKLPFICLLDGKKKKKKILAFFWDSNVPQSFWSQDDGTHLSVLYNKQGPCLRNFLKYVLENDASRAASLAQTSIIRVESSVVFGMLVESVGHLLGWCLSWWGGRIPW